MKLGSIVAISVSAFILSCILIKKSLALPLNDPEGIKLTTEIESETSRPHGFDLTTEIDMIDSELITTSERSERRGLDSGFLRHLPNFDNLQSLPKIRFTEITNVESSNDKNTQLWKLITKNTTNKDKDQVEDSESFFRDDLLIIGKNVKNSSTILLECVAPFPVSWKHDGLRITPTSTMTKFSNSTGPSNSFTITLAVGRGESFLRLKDKDSGNYTCSGEEEHQNLTTSLYIYVPVTYSADPCTEFPCGVNSICQVRHGNRSCSCRDNFVGNPYKKCRVECTLNSDCSDPMVCVDNKCLHVCDAYPDDECHVNREKDGSSQAQDDQNDNIISSLGGPCSRSTCGENAYCVEKYRKALAICHCFDNYFGDPWTKCHPECERRGHCPANLACMQGKCQDPCPGACGEGSQCQVVDQQASCSCLENFTGNPYKKCESIITEGRNFKDDKSQPGSEENFSTTTIREE